MSLPPGTLPPGTQPLVFESGVVRFDADGTLNVHLTHGADAPHPVQTHPDGRDFHVPADCTAVDLRGTAEAGAVHGGFPDTDALPEGLVFTIRGYTRVKLEASGDLTVELEGVETLPAWFEAGRVHRFDGPDDGVRIWSGSAPPPERKARPKPTTPRAKTSSPPPRTQATGGGGGCGLLLAAVLLASLGAALLPALA